MLSRWLTLTFSQTACGMATSVWAHEMSLSLTRSEAALSNMAENGLKQSKDYSSLSAAVGRLRAALRQAWKPQSNDVFAAECVAFIWVLDAHADALWNTGQF